MAPRRLEAVQLQPGGALFVHHDSGGGPFRAANWQTGTVPDIAFHLVADISSQTPEAIESLLIDLVDGSVTPTKDGFHVEGWMRGPDARELNRFLLSALRRVERRTRLRAEWTGEGETQRFFDYVPKGTRPAEGSPGEVDDLTVPEG